MTYSQSFIFIAIAIFYGYRIYGNKCKPIKLKKTFLSWCKTKEAKTYVQLMQRHYKNIDGFTASKHERHETSNKDISYTYGEIRFLSFAHVLQLASPKPGEVFYDVGAGTGKAVMAAALLYNFSAVRGVEILNGVYNISLDVKQAMQKDVKSDALLTQRLKAIQLIQDDIYRINFLDADIIFINATCFGNELWDYVARQLIQVKSGARIILLTKSLDLSYFKLLNYTRSRMSWDYASIRIYQRR